MSGAPPPSNRIGGMALANGLLVHGPRHWAAAVRANDGRVVVASGRKWTVRIGPVERLPLARGLVRLGEAFAVLPAVRKGLPEARFALEDRRTAIVAAGATVAAFVLRRQTRSVLAQEAIGAVLGLVPMLIAMRGSQAAVWHAVEHKSIAAYEADGPAGVEHAASHAKEHRRCGSNLVLPLMASTVVGNTITRRLPARLPGVRMAISALSVGTAVEMFLFASRRPRHPFSRLVHGAGHAMQAGFVTREPTADDLLVGRAAMDALIEAETGQPA